MQKSAEKLLKIGRKIHLVPYNQITNKDKNLTLTCKYYQEILPKKHQIVIAHFDKVTTRAPSKFFLLLFILTKIMNKYFLLSLKCLHSQQLPSFLYRLVLKFHRNFFGM